MLKTHETEHADRDSLTNRIALSLYLVNENVLCYRNDGYSSSPFRKTPPVFFGRGEGGGGGGGGGLQQPRIIDWFMDIPVHKQYIYFHVNYAGASAGWGLSRRPQQVQERG